MLSAENIRFLLDGLVVLTLQVSLGVVSIMLIRHWFGRWLGARACRLLWVVLVIRCLIPWAFFVPYTSEKPSSDFLAVSMLPSAEPEPEPVISRETQGKVTPLSESEMSAVVTVEPLSESETSAVVAVEPQGTRMPEMVPDVKPTLLLKTSIEKPSYSERLASMLPSFPVALAGIWLVGAVVLPGAIVFRNRRMARQVARAPSAVPDWIGAIFLECRDRLKIRTWPVLIASEGVASPCLVGAIRPRILLPKKLIDSSTPDEMRHVLLHELVHLKQGDIWFSWVWTVAVSLHWFNPFLWWAGRRVYFDCETACDERVLSLLEPARRMEYGHSLVGILQKLRVSTARTPGLSCLVERKTNFERRLTMIQSFRTRSTKQSFATVGVVAVLLAVSMTGFAASMNAEPVSAEKAEMMGRVEDYLTRQNGEIQARKTIEWGAVESLEDGSKAIRYRFEALMSDASRKIDERIFTFNEKGECTGVKQASGYPKEKKLSKPEVKVDTTTKEGMIALVKAYKKRWKPSRKLPEFIEWGEPETDQDFNRSICCKTVHYLAGKCKTVMEERYVFTPAGGCVEVDLISFVRDTSTKKAMIALVNKQFKKVESELLKKFLKNQESFVIHKTIEWGEPKTEEDGNRSIRYKYEAIQEGKRKKVLRTETMEKVFVFTPEGQFVKVVPEGSLIPEDYIKQAGKVSGGKAKNK